ncbi:MAG TPA: C4-dicarboxylate ABC transporter [Bacillota bacterium]|nr:C4-dicarboxylate ABC transporter [Bacillota bacterium]
MYAHAAMVLAVIAVAFVIAILLRLGTEISMLIAAIAGAIAHGAGIPARHIVEGTFTYFDVVFIFITATFFMNLLKEAGGVTYIVRGIISKFHKNRVALLLLLTLIMLVPGALTGSGTVTVLVVGSFVGTVLSYMGIPKDRVAAAVFMGSAMSAAAPPINLWAMMAAAGANMPYVGFTLPLGIISVAGALFSIFYLARGSKPIDAEQALKEIPEAPEGMAWYKVAIPFIVFFGIIILGRQFPFSMPVIGLPLAFMLSALAVVLLSPVKLRVFEILSNTVEDLLPLISTVTIVGILVQIMALSGARGLISLSVVTMPLAAIFAALFVVLPVSEGIFQYASAPLLGVPLVFLLNMKGYDPVIALAGMASMWPLGDCLPPTAPVGRGAVMAVGYDGDYKAFLKQCLVPALFVLVIGTLFVVFSPKLGFLARG